MCGFRLLLFSSYGTCSLIWEACKSFPFNHGIQESSPAMPNCLFFFHHSCLELNEPFQTQVFLQATENFLSRLKVIASPPFVVVVIFFPLLGLLFTYHVS